MLWALQVVEETKRDATKAVYGTNRSSFVAKVYQCGGFQMSEASLLYMTILEEEDTGALTD